MTDLCGAGAIGYNQLRCALPRKHDGMHLHLDKTSGRSAEWPDKMTCWDTTAEKPEAKKDVAPVTPPEKPV